MTNGDFTFYSKNEYFKNLISDIQKTKPGDRVLVMSMSFQAIFPEVLGFADALCAAAARGVKASLAIDSYVFMNRRQPLDHGTFSQMVAAAHEVLTKFQAAGGTYVITNDPGKPVANVYSGRSHIKTAVINDKVYVGGCNLADPSQIDMMTCFHDAKTADWLYDKMQQIVAKHNTTLASNGQDQQFELDSKTKLLVDSGIRKQSTIYDHALQLIDEAKEWVVITCQFFPHSITAKHLAAAYRRGLKVSIYYNHPSKHIKPHNVLHHLVVLHERTRRPSVLFKEQLQKDVPYLHSKIIATDQGAIIGSHNFVTVGVSFGTAEIALLRNDPQFSHKILQKLMSEL